MNIESHDQATIFPCVCVCEGLSPNWVLLFWGFFSTKRLCDGRGTRNKGACAMCEKSVLMEGLHLRDGN